MSATSTVPAGPAQRGLKRQLILGGVLATCALFIFVLFKGFGGNPHEVPFKLTGTRAPLFTMKRLDNDQPVSLKDFIGKPIVLNFWATWCGPCKLEHPVLEWAFRRHSKDVVFIGIVFEDNEENTKRFLRENGGSWTQLFDLKSTVAVDYAVSGVPETYFINRAGVIVGKVAEPISPQTMEERIAEILK